MPLIDPAEVPEDVVSAKGVASLNTMMDTLRARRAESIKMPEPPKNFRLANTIRAYCQSQLWRCLDLVDAAESLRRTNHGLGTMVMVRAIYETVAAFLHFERKLAEIMTPLESKADLERIDVFVHGKTFSTRLDDLLETVGADESSRATSVLTQIDGMKKVYADARKDYDHLCEFAHPNVFGGFLWFGHHDRETDTVTFSTVGPAPKETLFWSLQGAHLLAHFGYALKRIEGQLAELSALGEKEAV